MTQTKLALIGCGGMGQSHLRRFHTLSNRLELKAAVDINLETAQSIASQFPSVVAVDDYRTVL